MMNNETNFVDSSSDSEDENITNEYTTTANQRVNRVAAKAEKQKHYLYSPETHNSIFINLKDLPKDEFKRQKNCALLELQINLDEAQTLTDVCELFKEVADAKQGMLRYRRKHILKSRYTETESYKEAIDMIYEKALRHYPKTYAEYNQFYVILLEKAKLNPDNCQSLEITKEHALIKLENEIRAQYCLSKLMPYINFILEPESILRRHRDIIRYNYGDTKSYKSALMTISKKIIELPKTVCSPDENELAKLNLLHEAMEKCRPIFNKEWQTTTESLKGIIDSAAIEKNSSNENQQQLKR